MATLQNSDIVKGSTLMLFVDGSAIGFATSHSLSLTVNTSEVSTKDHGAFPAVIANSISWEVTAENLYSDAGNSTLIGIAKAKEPVTVVFANASNWTDNGIIDNNNPAWTAGTPIAQGQAIITSYSVNAPAGDNATISCTFTGVGELSETESPASNTVTDPSSGD